MVSTRPKGPCCTGIRRLDAFCVTSSSHLDVVRWACVAVLLVTASGWRPRLTCIPHWYVAASFYTSSSIPDGGDQVASVLTLLLIPVALGDPRRWHWQRLSPSADETSSELRRWTTVGAACFTFAVQLQVAGIYFQSSIAKLSHQEWADGTAMYYWAFDPSFGASGWLSPVFRVITGWGPTVTFLTWVPIPSVLTASVWNGSR
ncbi:sporulation-delaying protein SdpB family protein [Streptomyces sioyaensis]|uniref:sporulation-delaying protein SdpB family protein n=1 Tax=Streptomyces sioyaensis TaxID=67364 RepID=UPI0033FAA191